MVYPQTSKISTSNTLYSKVHKKLQSPIKFSDLKICKLTSTYLSFLCSSEYKVFEVDFLHVCGILYRLHLGLFSIFLNS